MATVQLTRINKVYPDGHLAVPDLDLSIGEGESGGSVTASVTYIENTGDKLHVYATLNGQAVTDTGDRVVVNDQRESTIAITMPVASDVNLWQSLTLSVDQSQLHLFSLTTGMAFA